MVVPRFMAPLLLWAAAVVIVFGVSFTNLANLQVGQLAIVTVRPGPLAHAPCVGKLF